MRSMKPIALVLLCIVCGLACAGCQRLDAPLGDAEGDLWLSGTIEAKEVAVAGTLGGRVVELRVDEGDEVAKDDLLVRLDADLLEAAYAQSEAAREQARGALLAAQAQLDMALAGARPQEVDLAESALVVAEANRSVAVARRDAADAARDMAGAGRAAAQGQLAAAEAAVMAAAAEVDRAAAVLSLARAGATTEEVGMAERTVEAAKNTLWGVQAQRDGICGHVDRGASQGDCDQAEAAVQAAEEQVRIAELDLTRVKKGARGEDVDALVAVLAQARAGVEASEANVAAAKANLASAQAGLAVANADAVGAAAAVEAAAAERDRAAANLELVREGSREEQIRLLRAQVVQAEAALAAAGAAVDAAAVRLDEAELIAPVGGIVIERTVHPGELAVAGSPLLVLADLDVVTLTVFVPEPKLGLVSYGQAAAVTVNAYHDAFEGRVTYIASQAEFTPKNLETREERVNKVFAVEITLDNPDHRLLPGMPADVVLN